MCLVRAADLSEGPAGRGVLFGPVIYCGGRQLIRDAGESRRAGSIVCGAAPVTTRPGRVIGAKPAAVCHWIFDLLGAAPGDTLDDLFPGSGAVTRAWAAFTGNADPSHPARGVTRQTAYAHPSTSQARRVAGECQPVIVIGHVARPGVDHQRTAAGQPGEEVGRVPGCLPRQRPPAQPERLRDDRRDLGGEVERDQVPALHPRLEPNQLPIVEDQNQPG